jgi:fumarate reductase flavoprotein subunit
MSQQAQVFDTEYDLAVIGSGGSGKSAALTAAQAGLSVVILEKLPVTGGGSVFAEGQAAFESSEQKARGVPSVGPDHYPTREEGYHKYLEYSHYRANPEVVRMFVENSAETIDVLKSLGVRYTDVFVYAYDQSDELATFHRPDGLGAACQEALLKAVENAGVDIFTSTRAERLVTRDGAVVGVVATDSGGNTLTIGAKAVILATGGYINNPEMIAKYSNLGGDNGRHVSALVPLENTGDGITMALEAGADLDNIGVMQLGPGVRGKQVTSQSGAAGFQPGLWVNKTGRRYTSEEVGMSFANAGTVWGRQPGCDSYGVIDADLVEHLTVDGSDVGLGDFIGYHVPLTRLQDELDEDVANGIAWRGETIEELARAAGFDPEVLARTVAEYNAACDAGHDPQFFKPAKYLRPVRKPPFHLVNISAHGTCTCGGIRVDGSLRVLAVDLRPIPGLYAVGNDASGLYGDAYTLDVPGSTNGFAHTSGRVAARHVIATLQGSPA